MKFLSCERNLEVLVNLKLSVNQDWDVGLKKIAIFVELIVYISDQRGSDFKISTCSQIKFEVST